MSAILNISQRYKRSIRKFVVNEAPKLVSSKLNHKKD